MSLGQGRPDSEKRPKRKRSRQGRVERRLAERRNNKQQVQSQRPKQKKRRKSEKKRRIGLVASFLGIYCLKRPLDQISLWVQQTGGKADLETVLKSRVRNRDKDTYRWAQWLHKEVLLREKVPAADVTIAEIRRTRAGRLHVVVTTRGGHYNWEVSEP